MDSDRIGNVLRKKDNHSPTHSRTPSYSTEATRHAAYKRQSRIGSIGSTGGESISPVSPAAKVYYGASPKGHRTSSAFEFVKPLKSANDLFPTVTKLEYGNSPSMKFQVCTNVMRRMFPRSEVAQMDMPTWLEHRQTINQVRRWQLGRMFAIKEEQRN
jgi:hypothetical protein